MPVIGIPREPEGEPRVAATPDTVRKLVEAGCTVLVERGAGMRAHLVDASFGVAGATLVDRDQLWADSEIVLTVGRPSEEDAGRLRQGATLVCWYDADEHHAVARIVADKGGTLLAAEAVPRITRAQKMDVRSSMAGLAGYRAVVEASAHLGRTFAGQVTAAGSMPPVKVLVIGAGVAGLAAISAARSLGAVVRAFDTREAAREQVTSLGAAFLEVELEESGEGQGGYAKEMSQAFLDAEFALFRAQAAEVDVVITTAAIPGRPAPKLWLQDMVERMPKGSVVVDLAAATGGNCPLTQTGQTVIHHGVSIVGAADMPQRLAPQASSLYANNLLALIDDLGLVKGEPMDLDDPIANGVTVVHQGTVRWPAAPPPAPAAPPVQTTRTAVRAEPKVVPVVPQAVLLTGSTVAVVLLALAGVYAPPAFLQHLTVFVLACIVGWLVVWNVTPALHTPLMSVTNAISGIIVVGGLLTLGSADPAAAWLGAAAVGFAAFNIFGGFTVTERMLGMFHRGQT